MKKNFRRASFQSSDQTWFEVIPYFSQDYYGDTVFTHVVVETIRNGFCVKRQEFFPWFYSYSVFRLFRAIRRLAVGVKKTHVKI